ncbi:hypothetical protein HanXRQr2_Chr12g0549421 [Helianthus annuus]|uniref:Uncharacterized protein n=1 Tax=Helianthus annuus TaxID=4232 RepID=A0A9K3HI26_HELAN|nr:hypothetical protein HanXRQr2_Chr12g0549421 [Helianthus annuus]KAJ0863353.1 hypothetical protein HanPSC8_Chr12g0529011 [Helianthus annuus]
MMTRLRQRCRRWRIRWLPTVVTPTVVVVQFVGKHKLEHVISFSIWKLYTNLEQQVHTDPCFICVGILFSPLELLMLCRLLMLSC